MSSKMSPSTGRDGLGDVGSSSQPLCLRPKAEQILSWSLYTSTAGWYVCLGEGTSAPCCPHRWTWPHHLECHWLQRERKSRNGEPYSTFTSFCSEFTGVRSAQISLSVISHMTTLNSKGWEWAILTHAQKEEYCQYWWTALIYIIATHSGRRETRIWQGLSWVTR